MLHTALVAHHSDASLLADKWALLHKPCTVSVGQIAYGHTPCELDDGTDTWSWDRGLVESITETSVGLVFSAGGMSRYQYPAKDVLGALLAGPPRDASSDHYFGSCSPAGLVTAGMLDLDDISIDTAKKGQIFSIGKGEAVQVLGFGPGDVVGRPVISTNRAVELRLGYASIATNKRGITGDNCYLIYDNVIRLPASCLQEQLQLAPEYVFNAEHYDGVIKGYAAYGSYMVNDFVFAPSDYLAYLAGPLPHLQASLIQQTAQLRARADLSRAMAAAKDRNTETAADKPFIVSLDLLGMAVFNEAFRGSKVTSDKAGICAVHEDATAMTTLLGANWNKTLTNKRHPDHSDQIELGGPFTVYWGAASPTVVRVLVSSLTRRGADGGSSYWSSSRSERSSARWHSFLDAAPQSTRSHAAASKQQRTLDQLLESGAAVSLAISDSMQQLAVSSGACGDGGSSHNKRTHPVGHPAVGLFHRVETDSLDWFQGQLFWENADNMGLDLESEPSFQVIYDDSDSESGLAPPMLPWVLTGGFYSTAGLTSMMDKAAELLFASRRVIELGREDVERASGVAGLPGVQHWKAVVVDTHKSTIKATWGWNATVVIQLYGQMTEIEKYATGGQFEAQFPLGLLLLRLLGWE